MKLSIFWKIFLGFWLTTVLMWVSVIFILAQFHDEPPSRELDYKARLELKKFAARLERSPRLIRKFREDLRTGRGKHRLGELYFIDEQRQDYLGQPIPKPLFTLLERYQELGEPNVIRHGRRIFVGPAAVNVKGSTFYLFIERPVAYGRMKLFTAMIHRASIVYFLLGLVISALVCLGLTYLFTSPIRKLQNASRQLAEGDFAFRAVDLMGNRKDEFLELAKDFDFMSEKLQAIIYSQKQLLSDISHELRSPLTRLQIANELAQNSKDEKRTEYFSRIDLETRRINEMIDQLLQIAALERGVTDEEKARISIHDLLGSVCEDARFEAQADNKEIVLRIGDEVTLGGYYRLLRSGLENVLRNAIRHTPSGSAVAVHQLRKDNGGLEIQIIDQGPGLEPHHLEKIFDPFYRASHARERAKGGSGLGLSIARACIKAHGGNISADNVEPSGLKVTIEVPAGN